MKALSRAIVEIAYDNGAVNRFQSEDVSVNNAMTALKNEFKLSQLELVNTALSLMTDEELLDICVNSQDSAEGIVARIGYTEHYKLIDEVLNTAFENL